METKLFPPHLEAKLPATFGDIIQIPYDSNPAVGSQDYIDFNIIIKTVSTNKLIYEGLVSGYNKEKKYIELLLQTPLTEGQYYKIQLAFVSHDGEIGYYSSVGTMKYTKVPTIQINGLKAEGTNNFNGSYQGLYSNDDITEKVYKYQFTIYDSQGNVLDTSGEMIHNSATDISGSQSYDIWEPSFIETKNEIYYITYSVTTVNNLELTSYKYQLSTLPTYDIDILVQLNTVADNDNGRVEVELTIGQEQETLEMQGTFVLLRSSEFSNFTHWEQLDSFKLNSQIIVGGRTFKIFTDYTVEHGVAYKYALQYCNPYNVHSNLILAKDEINLTFEDILLYDGERQLKLRFNPKVSSFKDTILETKTDTIGGKYPTFYRNGKVQYKEFPISALISMLMDDNKEFLSYTNTDKDYDFDTNLTSINYDKERNFKLEVLKWLNNGKPKLYRSAPEGNYIVRLMNINLTPNDTLGRMLHSFSGTAYEIADYSVNSLRNLGMIKIVLPEIFNQNNLIMNQYTLNKENSKIEFNTTCKYISFTTEPYLNTIVKCIYSDGNTQDILIGHSGYYEIPQQTLQNDVSIRSVELITSKNEVTILAGIIPESIEDKYEYNKIKDITAYTKIDNYPEVSGDILQKLLENDEGTVSEDIKISNVIYLRVECDNGRGKASVNINGLNFEFSENTYKDNVTELPIGVQLIKTNNGLELYGLGELFEFEVAEDPVSICIAYQLLEYSMA